MAKKHNIGEFLELPIEAIKNPVLGKIYTYKRMKVEVLHRGTETIKVQVVS